MKINISSILLLVSIYGDTSINCKEEQCRNISLILLTLVVLSDDILFSFAIPLYFWPTSQLDFHHINSHPILLINLENTFLIYYLIFLNYFSRLIPIIFYQPHINDFHLANLCSWEELCREKL